MEVNRVQETGDTHLETGMGRYAVLLLADLFLLLFSFFTIHFFKYGALVVGERHDHFLVILLVCWFIMSVFFKKLSFVHRGRPVEGAVEIAGAAVILAAVLSLVIVTGGLTNMSRLLVYGTVFLYAALEAAAFFLYKRAFQKAYTGTEERGQPKVRRSVRDISVSVMLGDAFLLMAGFYLATYWKRGQFAWTGTNLDIFFFLFGAWLFVAIVLDKFNKDNFHSIYNVIGINIKSLLSFAAVLAFVIFGFRYHYMSRTQILGAIVLFSGLELALFLLYYRYKGYSGILEGQVFPAGIQKRATRQVLECPEEEESPCLDPVDEKLNHALYFFEPKLYGFIRNAVDLSAVDSSETSVMFTENLFNVGVLEDEKQKLIVNLHKINDIRFLNQYFLLAHTKLKPGGYLVGKAHTLETHRDFFFSHFPGKYLGRFLYIFDFIWGRVLPKLPLFKKIYFGLTKGRNRLVSRAEILGRLFYCGFRPVAEESVAQRFYFVARKVMTPADDPDPTYGPLVSLKRYGLHGKPITVYKFRTMHPYSEYLQEYVYERNKLKEGGKFKDDFRVTAWGAFMRKCWIDELPMLYNWLRGDLQLVGVRPLSRQYLEIYTPEHRQLRRQVKPGLLPPYYADMPTTLEEIMESERRYIEAYRKNPVKTQVTYFFKCVYNILFKKRRSA